ncbi:MAG: transposase [Elusimicrobia bacterium]|nr:transposase [Elusimicrobiota bacterium]
MENTPHHIVQRGNRCQKVFFSEKDKELYLKILKQQSSETGIKIWAYCLMDNHVHIIAVPLNEKSLSIGIGKTHMKYTRTINKREGWKGFLWQGRFMSNPLDEKYLYAAVRYVENNPVRAGLVRNAEDYKWSSARAHVKKEKNILLENNFMNEEIKNWAAYLSEEDNQNDLEYLRKCINTGRPLGSEEYVKKIENKTGRILFKKKPGPKNN